MWSHPRLGEEALQQDLQDCRRSAAGEVSGPFLSPVVGSEFFAERDEALQRCMESRGWRLIEAPPGARAPYPRSLRGY